MKSTKYYVNVSVNLQPFDVEEDTDQRRWSQGHLNMSQTLVFDNMSLAQMALFLTECHEWLEGLKRRVQSESVSVLENQPGADGGAESVGAENDA